MNTTLQGILEQFQFWRQAATPTLLSGPGPHVVVGCGTSYYLALSVAAALNEAGHTALAVPGGEWTHRPQAYLPVSAQPHVIALSRSGESTETVQAAIRSRDAGYHVTAITCEEASSLAQNADTVLFSSTHPAEGIVMTASASLMLLCGLRLAGQQFTDAEFTAAEALLKGYQNDLKAILQGRTHFVYLGGGVLHGLAQEGALKLQEMSLTYTQAYHPMEYRHGPISLVDERTLAVLLYHPNTQTEEAKLAAELRGKGAKVIGLGGPGDLELPVAGNANVRALTALPTLQLLGELVAQSKGLDSVAPRHLTKVVTLA